MTEYLGYDGKRVLVSGCFSGMGHATAKKLSDLGAEVHGIDYKPTDLSLASFTEVDLRDPAQIDDAVASLGGRIDAVFNCAGLPQTAAPLDVMKVNFAGTRRVAEQALPFIPEGGAIANISSTGGLGWSRRIPVIMELLQIQDYADAIAWCEAHMDEVREGYSFSKEAVIVWTMLASSPLAKQGVRINCTLPGPTKTPMFDEFLEASGEKVVAAATQPTNRYSTPDEQADALIFLNSHAARFVSGAVLPVDGGFIGGVTTGQVDLSVMMSNQK